MRLWLALAALASVGSPCFAQDQADLIEPVVVHVPMAWPLNGLAGNGLGVDPGPVPFIVSALVTFHYQSADGGAEIERSEEFLLTPTLEPTSCPYVTRAGVSNPLAPGDGIGAVWSFVTDGNGDVYAKRVAQLEAWGLKVETIGLGSSSVLMRAKCIGIPQ